MLVVPAAPLATRMDAKGLTATASFSSAWGAQGWEQAHEPLGKGLTTLWAELRSGETGRFTERATARPVPLSLPATPQGAGQGQKPVLLGLNLVDSPS